MLDIYDEFRRLVEAFDAQKVDYALCGGMAMAVHKRPRMTIDIDILIPGEFLDRVIPIARDLGYNIRGKDLSFANGAVERRRISKLLPRQGFALVGLSVGDSPARECLGLSSRIGVGGRHIHSCISGRIDCDETAQKEWSGFR